MKVKPLDKFIAGAVLALFLAVLAAVLWFSTIGPALDCRSRGGDGYWRRDHWWERYGTYVCEEG